MPVVVVPVGTGRGMVFQAKVLVVEGVVRELVVITMMVPSTPHSRPRVARRHTRRGSQVGTWMRTPWRASWQIRPRAEPVESVESVKSVELEELVEMVALVELVESEGLVSGLNELVGMLWVLSGVMGRTRRVLRKRYGFAVAGRAATLRCDATNYGTNGILRMQPVGSSSTTSCSHFLTVPSGKRAQGEGCEDASQVRFRDRFVS
jgi:hypothetical protein